MKGNKQHEGVPEPPTLFAKDKGNDDPIALVRAHLEAEYGKEEATAKLRTMTGLQVLELADKLRAEQTTKSNEDGEGVPQAPKLFAGRR